MFLLSERFTPFLRQYLVIGTVNFSLINLGIDMLWASPMLVKLRDSTDPVLSRPITDTEAAWIVTISTLGTLLANFLSAYLQDRVGRKFCIVFSSVPRLLCYLILIIAREPWLVILARFFTGFGDGFTYNSVSVYTVEIASKEIRGKLGALQQVIIHTGSLFMLSAGPYLAYHTLNIIIFCIFALSSVPMMSIPDSPYFMYTKGKKDEAKKLLVSLRGSASLAKDEIADFEQMTNNDKRIPLREVLRSKTVRKSLIVVVLFYCICHCCGYNPTQSYLQTILVSTQTDIKPEIISVIIGCIQLASSVVAIFVNDRFNRKPIAFVSLASMSIGMSGLGTFFWLKESTESAEGFLNILPLISLITIFVGFGAGLGGMMWSLMTELFEGPVRTFGCGCIVLTTTIISFLVCWFFLPLVNAIGSGPTFWIFSCMCLILLAYYQVFFPETKGKSLVEIQTALGKEPVDKKAISNAV